MSIVDTELIAYASLNMPTADTGTSGGGIDVKRRVVFTDIAATDDTEVVSTSAGDTQNCTITGRLANGVIASQTLALTGVTPVNFSTNAFERILKVDLASDAVGTITVRRDTGDTTIGTIPIGERGFMRLFYDAASDPSTGKTRYEKFFWKNTNGTLALTQAQVLENADPQTVITHALEASKDGTQSVTNRLTVPSGGLTFDGSAKAVPSGFLGPGEAIGVWVLQTLTAGQAGFKNTYTSQLTGAST